MYVTPKQAFHYWVACDPSTYFDPIGAGHHIVRTLFATDTTHGEKLHVGVGIQGANATINGAVSDLHTVHSSLVLHSRGIHTVRS